MYYIQYIIYYHWGKLDEVIELLYYFSASCEY